MILARMMACVVRLSAGSKDQCPVLAQSWGCGKPVREGEAPAEPRARELAISRERLGRSLALPKQAIPPFSRGRVTQKYGRDSLLLLSELSPLKLKRPGCKSGAFVFYASLPEYLRARGLESGGRRSLLDATAGRRGLLLPMFMMHWSHSDIIEQVVNQASMRCILSMIPSWPIWRR